MAADGVPLYGRPESVARMRQMLADPAKLAEARRVLDQAGVVAVGLHGAHFLPVAECARCGTERMLTGRGLCQGCRQRCTADGTLGDYGYTKAQRMADYALLRTRKVPIQAAGRQLGVTDETARRYERELDDAGLAPWRATDPLVQTYGRPKHEAIAARKAARAPAAA